MPPTNLADLLELLSGQGQLLRIEHEVDAELQLGHLAHHVTQKAGPALLFQRIRGRELVVASNLLGSVERICLALGTRSLDEFAERLELAAQDMTKPSWLQRLTSSHPEAALARLAPKPVGAAACQQVVRVGKDVQLGDVAVVRSWPEESARLLTGGYLLAETDQRRWIEAVPLAALDQRRLAVQWSHASPLFQSIRRAEATGATVPVAFVLGGPPPLTLLAQLPTGESDPMALAGLLNDAPLTVVNARTQPLAVPSEAEIVVEGVLRPGAADELNRSSCEFVAPGGSCQRLETGDVIEVSAVTQRNGAALPHVVYGPAPDETSALGPLRERWILPLLRQVVPELVEVALPDYGGPHQFAFVALRKSFAGQGRQSAGALWGHPALMLIKQLVIVDEDTNVHDVADVLGRVGRHARPDRDLFVQDGPAHRWHHAAGDITGKTKIGIDATAKLAGETTGNWPRPAKPDSDTTRWVEEFFQHSSKPDP